MVWVVIFALFVWFIFLPEFLLSDFGISYYISAPILWVVIPGVLLIMLIKSIKQDKSLDIRSKDCDLRPHGLLRYNDFIDTVVKHNPLNDNCTFVSVFLSNSEGRMSKPLTHVTYGCHFENSLHKELAETLFGKCVSEIRYGVDVHGNSSSGVSIVSTLPLGFFVDTNTKSRNAYATKCLAITTAQIKGVKEVIVLRGWSNGSFIVRIDSEHTEKAQIQFS